MFTKKHSLPRRFSQTLKTDIYINTNIHQLPTQNVTQKTTPNKQREIHSIEKHVRLQKNERSRSLDRIPTVSKASRNRLLLAQFIRIFWSSLSEINGSYKEDNELNYYELELLLKKLGYNIDEEICKQIYAYLSHNDKKIGISNILIFLLVCNPIYKYKYKIIQGICPLEISNTVDQKELLTRYTQIQEKFQWVNEQRNLNLLHQRPICDEPINDSYTPIISKNSMRLAYKRRLNLSTNNNEALVQGFPQWIEFQRSSDEVKHKRRIELQNQIQAIELKECSFKPLLSQASQDINKMIRCNSNFIQSPTMRLYEIKVREDCTENLIPLNTSITPTHKSNIKKFQQVNSSPLNQDRMNQMKGAREYRSFKNNFIKRGYPDKVKDWTQYFQSHKKLLNKTTKPDKENMEPLLYVNVELGSIRDNILIFPNANINQLVNQFAQKHSLNGKQKTQFHTKFITQLSEIMATNQ